MEEHTFGHLVDLQQRGKKNKVSPGVLVDLRSWGGKKMEEAPRRTLSASTPRHPPLVRTSPPRRAKRRGGSRDARAERAPPRPPEAWRRTRRLREKALPPLQPAVPDGRAEDGDPHRASPRRGHRRRRRAPSSALRLGQGRRARGCGGRRRQAAVATARGSHTQGERRKGKEKRTVLGRRRRRRSPPNHHTVVRATARGPRRPPP